MIPWKMSFGWMYPRPGTFTASTSLARLRVSRHVARPQKARGCQTEWQKGIKLSLARCTVAVLVSPFGCLQQHSELLIFEEELTYPLLQILQAVLPFFQSLIWLFMQPSYIACARHALHRRKANTGAGAKGSRRCCAAITISNAKRHHCRDAVSIPPFGDCSDEFLRGIEDSPISLMRTPLRPTNIVLGWEDVNGENAAGMG
jgi:hypothetical protein